MSKFLKALILWIVFLVGVALIVLPFFYHMFDRTDAADQLMTAFTPIVNTDHATLLGQDLTTLQGMAQDTQSLVGALPAWAGKTGDELNQFLGGFPKLAGGMDQMEAMLNRLGADTKAIGEQVENFAKANELPMKWTPWIFIIPGGIIVVLLLLRTAMWRPSKKEAAPAEPPAPAV
jgi:uncharacterized protein YukE